MNIRHLPVFFISITHKVAEYRKIKALLKFVFLLNSYLDANIQNRLFPAPAAAMMVCFNLQTRDYNGEELSLISLISAPHGYIVQGGHFSPTVKMVENKKK